MTGKTTGDERYVWVDIWFPRKSQRLVEALSRAARSEKDPATKAKLRGIAARIIEESKPPKPYVDRVQRPRGRDAEAVRRVVNGDAPFPVLSLPDAQVAFLVMRGNAVSLAEMGRRLHMHPRTVSRWVTYYEEGRWQPNS